MLDENLPKATSMDTGPVLGDDILDATRMLEVAGEIMSVIKGHSSQLNKVWKEYERVRENLEKRRNELESRLRSSNELFAISALRASLITVVVVSVGFVLLRAFAAELTQARRMSIVEMTSILTNNYPKGKLEYIPAIVRAISGDKTNKALAEGTPPDTITAAAKLGEAVSKFAGAAKSRYCLRYGLPVLVDRLISFFFLRSRQMIRRPPPIISKAPGNRVSNGASAKIYQPMTKENGMPKYSNGARLPGDVRR